MIFASQDCNIYIIAVPTPVTKKNKPDLKILKNACSLVAKVIKKKSIVIFSQLFILVLQRTYVFQY